MTTKIISENLSYPINRIKYSDDIYDADTTSLFKVVRRIKDKYDSAMMTGHNPGLTNFANVLTNLRVDNIPTCGILCVKLAIKSWLNITENCGSVIFFKFPKNL